MESTSTSRMPPARAPAAAAHLNQTFVAHLLQHTANGFLTDARAVALEIRNRKGTQFSGDRIAHLL
jgi:hypothetical protein